MAYNIGLAQEWRTEVLSALNPYWISVFGLTFSYPSADVWLTLSAESWFGGYMKNYLY